MADKKEPKKITCCACHTDNGDPLVLEDGNPYHYYHRPSKQRPPIQSIDQLNLFKKTPVRVQ